jgi:hypothetical protein
MWYVVFCKEINCQLNTYKVPHITYHITHTLIPGSFYNPPIVPPIVLYCAYVVKLQSQHEAQI